MGFLSWVTAWIVLIVVSIALSRTLPGQKIIHYILWLSIILILVTRYQEISSIFTVPGTNVSQLTRGQQ